MAQAFTGPVKTHTRAAGWRGKQRQRGAQRQSEELQCKGGLTRAVPLPVLQVLLSSMHSMQSSYAALPVWEGAPIGYAGLHSIRRSAKVP